MSRAVSPWNLSQLMQSRATALRQARNAQAFAIATDGETRRVWRDHCREKVRAARADNRLIVRKLRQFSASMFLRKTIGPELRAH